MSSGSGSGGGSGSGSGGGSGGVPVRQPVMKRVCTGSMLVHDLRLLGKSPTTLADNVYEVDAKVPVKNIIDWISTFARSRHIGTSSGSGSGGGSGSGSGGSDAGAPAPGGAPPVARGGQAANAVAVPPGCLKNLYIMCHGYEANVDLGNRQSTKDTAGGFGLQLGAEGITLSNADFLNKLKGDIKTITIYACGTADTIPGNVGTRADGRRFCGEIALRTGATVIAAVQAQQYNYGPGDAPIDFGAWEGPVYSFSPDDGSATLIQGDPNAPASGCANP